MSKNLGCPSGLVVYQPRGAALEHAAFATNIYSGCDHGCQYCYGPAATHTQRGQFGNPAERKDYLERLERDAAKVKPSDPILLCFTCDPYSQFDAEHGITRKAIEILHRHGHHVAILTKGGSRALRDLDLFGPGDSFGTTLTFINDADSLAWEPGAALPGDRLDTLKRFHDAGIPTWASMEPVIDPVQTLQLIRRSHRYIDLYKVGRWNHDVRANGIDWAGFAADVTRLLDSLDKPYRIKDALRPFLPAGVAA
jgi:DNA repair photolyase